MLSGPEQTFEALIVVPPAPILTILHGLVVVPWNLVWVPLGVIDVRCMVRCTCREPVKWSYVVQSLLSSRLNPVNLLVAGCLVIQLDKTLEVRLRLLKKCTQILCRLLGMHLVFRVLKWAQTIGLQQLAICRTVSIPSTPVTVQKGGTSLVVARLSWQTLGTIQEQANRYTVSP